MNKERNVLFKFINNIEEIIITISFLFLVIVCFVQVFCRFVLNFSFPWGEEFMRAMFLWASAFGISAAYKVKSHLGVDAVVNLFPKRIKKGIGLMAYVLSLVFCIIMIIYGSKITLMHVVSKQISISMGTPIALVSIAIPLGFAMTFIRIVQSIIEEIKSKNKLNNNEETHISEGLL